ncbi:sugar ABC transporter ATP-binding protein [Microbaculum marinisediminis]|uniref:Sugar ABC transporter ATP-binding protein n=1 Tax=Microbaculum marinisediminis TaxID=2931392 RepID=A0AAW5QWP7_9HYPH|nr:sugar ABC transporter ATP-binding protein [Microbaculum sp. A6E488]MCT8971324.1 sugar ABC transporter ATP-binding protein [Microbaculum sp. A6E488]
MNTEDQRGGPAFGAASSPGNDRGPAFGAAPLLETRGISKQYPGVLALDRVDFDLKPGEVHILFGENGAGKSTLISILAGVQRPTQGEVRFRGEKIEHESVHQARELGISAVFQEFSLVPQMTVEENLFLGAEITRGGVLDKVALHRRAQEIIDRLGFPLRPGDRVQHLTRAEQQMVEIAKAFRSDLSVLILDEPTASLTDRETEQLFALIDQIKAEGVGVVYITHRMQEIRRIGDRITVLRDGRYVATLDAKTAGDEELVRLMTGRVISELFPSIRFEPGEERLRIDRLTTPKKTVVDASLTVRSGEIVGLAGLVGSGKSEIMRAAFGVDPVATGKVTLKGEDISGLSTRERMNRGLFYIPPDRREEGLIMMRSCRENMSLPSLDRAPFAKGGLLDRVGEARRAGELADRMNLQPRRIERAVDHFSGGNQQKVLLAKCLTRPVDVYVFDEPTVGVDVGTRAAIYAFIRDLCEAGAAVVLISSDLPEILHLTNRVYVFYRGRVMAEVHGEDITEENLLKHFFEREAA